MKGQNIADAFEIVKIFQKDVLQQPPSLEQMHLEVRMMNFKIRPIQGDLSTLNFQDREFIVALWSLGKLDDFFQEHFSQLQKQQQEVFYRLMNMMRFEFQNKLNKANIKPQTKNVKSAIFEMEIFKEQSKRNN